jgi:hypothetical protein
MSDTYSAERKLSEHFKDQDGILVPIVPDTSEIEGKHASKEQLLPAFDPEWYICQTSVSLIGKFYFKDELKVGEGEYGKYCSFSLRTKKLKRGVPWTSYFYVKVWGDDLVTLLQQLKNETFIKVVGDLEVYRNTTYIRAKTIIPLLNAQQMIEEIKAKEALAMVNQDAEQLDEMRLAQEQLRSISDEVQKTIRQGSGSGAGLLRREEPDIPVCIMPRPDEEGQQTMINEQKKKIDTGIVTGNDLEHFLLAMSGIENQEHPGNTEKDILKKKNTQPFNTEEDEEYLDAYLGEDDEELDDSDDSGESYEGEDIFKKMNELILKSEQENQKDFDESEEEDDINIIVLDDTEPEAEKTSQGGMTTPPQREEKTRKTQRVRRSAFTRPSSKKRT